MGSVVWRCSLCMRCEGVGQVVQMTKDVQKEANKVAKSGTVTRIEYCYLAYLAVMLFARGIGLYEGTTIYTVTLLTGLFLFALKIMMTDHTVYEYLWMGAFLLLSLIIYAGTGEKGFLVYMTMMLGLKNVSMRKIFRTGAVIWGIAFSAIFFLTLTGVVPEKYFMHNKSGIGYVICHAMGYPHSNVFHIAYLVLAAFIIYQIGSIKGRKLAVTVLLLMAGNIYVFFYSMSFTGFFATTVFLFFYTYLQIRGKLGRIERILAQMIFPVCVIFSVAGPVIITGRLYDLINKALNTRFALSNYFLTQQPITLFGTRFVVPNYRYTMDCSYVYLFMQLGIVAFMVICVLYIALIHDCIRKERYTELAIILGMCVAGVTEPYMFNLAYKNLIFLFAGAFLFAQSEKRTQKLPAVLRKHIQLLHSGNCAVSDKLLITDRIAGYAVRIGTEWKCSHTKYMIGLIAAAFVMTGICAIGIREPAAIYINEEINESRDIAPVYLSEEQVQQLIKEGNIVKDYEGEKVPMYPYIGNTVHIEYVRMLISTGLWTGMLIITATAAVRIRRSRRKH